MSDTAKEDTSCGGSDTGTAPWYPLRKGWQSNWFHQDLGLPTYLESGDALWMDSLRRGSGGYSWPGCVSAPLFVPHDAGLWHQPSPKATKWRVSMDMGHFSPSEISLSLNGTFLEVKGKHEERPDEHGFIARCFTRKYRVPAEVDATKITSTLSVNGILAVEAPVPDALVPAAVIIPIKVEIEGGADQDEVHQKEDVPQSEEDTRREPQEPAFPVSSDHGEGISVDPVQTGDSPAGLQQQEDKRGQDEEESGEAPMTVPEHDEGLQDIPSEQYEVLESPKFPDPSEEPKDQAGENGEVQAAVGSTGAAEMTIPEDQELKGQELEGQELKGQELEGQELKGQELEGEELKGQELEGAIKQG